MAVEVELVGQGARVRIEVLGYAHREATDSSDANWLNCQVEGFVSSFTARIVTFFTTQDFATFARALRACVTNLEGSALFDTYERSLQLEVAFNRRGGARVAGTVREADPPFTSLTFSFESDQTFFTRTADALEEVVRRFPVRP